MSYVQPTTEEIAERRAQLAPFDRLNEQIWLTMWAAIAGWQGFPRSYLDVGSGTGAMVNLAQKVGVESVGVDIINGPEHWFVAHDLTQPLRLEVQGIQRAFELVTCLEVAEHLPEDAANTLCDTIARHMASNSLLVFSAATPGQAGEHHLNVQHAWYWRSKFYGRGVSYRADYTAQLSHIWSWVAGPLMWLGSNVMVFDK